MKQISTIGLDLAKQVFQVHGVDAAGKTLFNKKLLRAEVEKFFKSLPSCDVAMEACSSAHHWARSIAALGHRTMLIPAQYVKPFVKRGKTDAADAQAICTAVVHGNMRLVPVKSIDQQAITVLFQTRSLFIRQRTKAFNALRSHLAEFGLIAARGTHNLNGLIDLLRREDCPIPTLARRAILSISDEITTLKTKITELDRELTLHASQDDDISRLTTIPGVGRVTAGMIKAYVPDPGSFKSARHFAAWLGLTPKAHSSGGKARVGRISKMGNANLRSLLVIGAMTIIREARKDDGQQGWVQRLLLRRPYKVVAVAMANKTARIIWALLNKGGTYRGLSGSSENQEIA